MRQQKSQLQLTYGNSISSYVYVTVPVVFQIWLRYQHDYFGGVKEIISLGRG